MNDRIRMMRKFFIEDREHASLRQAPADPFMLARRFSAEGTDDLTRAVERVRYVVEKEIPHVFPFEKIALMRTVPEVQEIFTEEEMAAIKKDHWVHESGDLNNDAPDYITAIRTGFRGIRERIAESRASHAGEPERLAYLDAMEEMLRLLTELVRRYREEALRTGNTVVAETLSRIPEEPAETLLEAFQFFRIIHYGLWCANNYQATCGRADQYFYPYYEADIEAGRLDRESALELVEEFFLSFNRDADLYPGVQQGDNGQSLVLGGRNMDGTDSYNDLSSLMMRACLELRLIDPKINLRVDSRTPFSRFVEATELTKVGIGFPQYLNDDVNIPALLRWEYEEEDAYNYTAAACWELIIPGKGADTPNANGLSFAKVVSEAAKKHLASCGSYEEFEEKVREELFAEVDRLVEGTKNNYTIPAPMQAIFMTGCIENAQEPLQCCRYRNIGFHAPGLSTGADSMAAIRELVFEKKTVTAEELLDALARNFEGEETLRDTLRYETPKMGTDDDRADKIGEKLLSWAADALEGRRTESGGIYRIGTASAMYYIEFGQSLGATADGRTDREPLPCNYSPSLFAKALGPISTVKSFTKPDLVRVANGGPLTIELHDTVFRSPDSVEKVAQLVKLYIDRGGHELQINAVNRENMLDAQVHPERWRSMIVRVWGWSGYFVELDKEYQDQIISRTEFSA